MTSKFVRDVIHAMERFAPLQLAMPGDVVGLQIGRLDKPLTHVRLALEASPEVITAACQDGVDMLVTHHALLYRPVTKVDTSTARGGALAQALAHDLAVYSAHTNLDITDGGVNDVLAELLQLSNLEILDRTKTERMRKLVVYVPETHQREVRDVVCQAGAGQIGEYSHCTFSTAGEGTFLPLEGANPFVGEPGKLERVREVRVETIVPEGKVETIVQAMLEVHPYEEVAYDIYPLDIMGKSYGLGRVGNLQTPLRLTDFASRCRDLLGLTHIRFAGDPETLVQRIAIVGGSGSKWISKALERGAQVLLTADCDHHALADAWQDGLAVIDATHASLERPVLKRVKQFLDDIFGTEVQIDIARGPEDPFHWL